MPLTGVRPCPCPFAAFECFSSPVEFALEDYGPGSWGYGAGLMLVACSFSECPPTSHRHYSHRLHQSTVCRLHCCLIDLARPNCVTRLIRMGLGLRPVPDWLAMSTLAVGLRGLRRHVWTSKTRSKYTCHRA